MAKQAKAKAANEGLAFDEAASERVLAACGSIASLASTAIQQSSTSVAPFLGFAQRSRIGALAVNFEGGPSTMRMQTIVSERPAAVVTTAGGGLSREEIDAIVSHRVEIALTETLQRMGVAPDTTIGDQVDTRIGGQISDQENRILDYVRAQLTDSLRVFEERLDERLGELEAARRSDAVDEQLEQAREDLLKNIDEVRTVDVGMDQFAFAAGIVEVDGTGSSETIDEVIEAGGVVELGDGTEQAFEGEVEAEAYEGEVEAEAYEGEVEAEAYEGEVEAEAYEGEVEAEAYEGEVEAEAYEG
ncbi:MAG: hypothetical protein KDA24_26310, partial [Deltaproteobacteria bacterium]|nr:hypothetical protein [Deltaproteobacteria bacterium]